MKTFKVKIETSAKAYKVMFTKSVDIEAKSEEEALQMAKSQIEDNVCKIDESWTISNCSFNILSRRKYSYEIENYNT